MPLSRSTVRHILPLPATACKSCLTKPPYYEAIRSIVRGVRVTVLNSQPGPLLLRVGEGRYAIGRGMAQRILVVPCH
jgi:hypothetical protein